MNGAGGGHAGFWGLPGNRRAMSGRASLGLCTPERPGTADSRLMASEEEEGPFLKWTIGLLLEIHPQGSAR